MFDFFKKKPALQSIKVQIKINGMHCTSCSLNIDGELEDTPGVIAANTSYAEAITTVEFDPNATSETALRAVIKKLGYSTE